MVQGHLKQEQQGLQSTTSKKPHTSTSTNINNTEDISPLLHSPNLRKHNVAYAIIDPTNMTNAYFDLTGKFPQRSSSGNQYIFVGYKYDANSILAEPIKNKTTTSITSA